VPSSTDDRQGFLRVRYCAHARTIENQLYVVHSPTVGSLPSVPDVFLNYGQASILTPNDYTFARDGILAEGVLNQEMIIVGELDMTTIEESRSFGTVLPLLDSHHTKELISQLDVISL
jgi:predicted amidohydrolase